MKISVLIPSRNNVKNLLLTVNSFINTVSDKNKLEILVALDIDDSSKFIVLEELKNNSIVKVIECPRFGYWKHNEYHNLLANNSTGNFLFLGSDKSTMHSNSLNWDLYLEKYKNDFVVCGQKTEWINDDATTFMRTDLVTPMFSKTWYDILNCVSTQPHLDSFFRFTIQELSKINRKGAEFARDMYKYIPEIVISHDRRKSAPIDKPGTFDFFSDASIAERKRCAYKIFNYLINK